MKATSLTLAAGVLLWSSLPASGSRLPDVVPNDNRVPAGVLQSGGDTLKIELEIRMATWRPESDTGPAIDVAAFTEAGKAPSIPAPLIRVSAGTTVVASVRNLLSDSTVSIHGLITRPAIADDSLVLRPGESSVVRFDAGAPGTYLYYAVLGSHRFNVDDEREQLGGALIVDPPGGSPPDRVFVLNIWGHKIDSTTYGNALTINGRSWPYDERITTQVGDTLRWRIVNVSERNHPMHLHGFYFLLESLGNGLTDTIYRPADRKLLVTQAVRPFGSMSLAWSPDRPGNWLFHCHIGFHVLPEARLQPPPHGHGDYSAHDPDRHMSGLVLGIDVRPRPGYVEAERRQPQRLHLFVQEGHRRGRAPRSLGFVLQQGDTPPNPDSVVIPGSPIVLTRGRPTDIVVVNRLREPTSIHWHGIELESYSDGVPGWSGSGNHLAPSIAPGDSFVARLTLPRAGTFMYHTHLNDIEQITSGLYGGIVVLEPGERFDSTTDHLFVAGWDGPTEDDSTGPRTLINGDSLPAVMELAAGVSHRFRFVNIGPANRFDFMIFRDTSLVSWRRVAKDGADLPPTQAILVPARQNIEVGETFDVELTLEPGDYRLVAARDPKKPYYVRRLIAR
ncbi:MAG TPA: multicopper oxidase domain-containing protein [Gemmatimonadaceae bacterium]